MPNVERAAAETVPDGPHGRAVAGALPTARKQPLQLERARGVVKARVVLAAGLWGAVALILAGKLVEGGGAIKTPARRVRLRRRTVTLLVGLCITVAVGVFATDTRTPHGFSVHMLYVIPVLLGGWLPGRFAPLALAAVGTLLTTTGYFLSPAGAETFMPLVPIVNRALSIAVFWITGGLVIWRNSLQRRSAESEARFRGTFEQAAVGIAHVGLDGRWLRVNRRLCDIVGYPQAKLLSKTFQDITHPDDLNADLEHARRLLAGDINLYFMEKRYIRRDGSVVWVNLTVSLVRDGEDGNPCYFISVIQDISEKKRTEQDLERLKAAVEGANDAIMITASKASEDPRIVYVNSAFSQMFGYADNDVVGQPCRILYESNADPNAMARMREELTATGIFRGEMRNRRKDGAEMMADWRVTRIHDGTRGSAMECVAILRDMTEHYRLTRALQQSEECARRQLAELEALYRTAPIGLGMFSRDLRFVRTNETLAEINGLPVSDHIDRSLWEVVPTIADQIAPLFRQVLETGQSITNIEIVGETANAPGVTRVWRDHFYPAVNPEGDIEGVAVVVEDITEQKRNEEHLKLVMNELNHRVKNTLAIVLSIASQTLQTSASLDDFGRSFIGRIRSLASTHTLLTQTNWHSAGLRDLVRETTRPYCGTAGDSAVETHGCDVELVPSAALALSMVLHELATNAAKYGALSSPDGKVKISWVLTQNASELGLRFRWLETGGPKVSKPTRRGFGSDLIDFTIHHEFKGNSKVDYEGEGVRCEIVIPWSSKIGWLH